MNTEISVLWTCDDGSVVYSEVSWTSRDALVVTVTFMVNNGVELIESRPWRFARDLLDDAFKNKGYMCGEGDVKAGVSIDGTALSLTLDSSSSSSTLITGAVLVGRFLEGTYSRVPRGSEEVDIDSELKKLFQEM